MSQDTVEHDAWARHHAAYGPASWGSEATQQVPVVEDDRAAFTQGWQRPAFHDGGPVGPSNYAGPQHPAPAPPVPPTKARIPFWIWALVSVGALAILLSIIAALGGTPIQKAPTETLTVGTSPRAVAAPKAAEKKAVAGKPKTVPAPGPAVGKAFRAGDFRFTVHAKKCGLATAGTNPYLKTRAQGSFCRLDVSAENVTKTPAYFNADSLITATDTQGREFSADTTAGTYGNDPDSAGFYDEVNPGNKIRSFVFFDIPKGATLKSVTFDAGLFTSGKTQTLTF